MIPETKNALLRFFVDCTDTITQVSNLAEGWLLFSFFLLIIFTPFGLFLLGQLNYK